MALGKTHDAVNLAVLPAFLYFLPKEFYIPFGAGYLVGTFLLSPDIDMPTSNPSKRWSLLRFIWYPYQKFSKHRGLSHVPVIGSLLRLFYITAVVVFLYFSLIGVLTLLDRNLSLQVADFNLLEHLSRVLNSEEGLYFVAGIICADVVHIVLDILWSFFRRIA